MKAYDNYKHTDELWLGDIPSHWKRHRIKYCLSRSETGEWGADEKGDANDIVCIRTADFDYNGGIIRQKDYTIRNVEITENSPKLLQKNDLIVERSGGGDIYPVGRIVRFPYEMRAICSNFLQVISLKDTYSANFFYYYFRHLYTSRVNALFYNQTTGIQNLTINKYFGQSVYLPPYEEQMAIANYLDKKSEELDTEKQTLQGQINLLKELKLSIITNAVTKGLAKVALKESGIMWIGEVPNNWEVVRLKNYCFLKGRIGWKGLRSDEFKDKAYAYLVTGEDFKSSEVDWSQCYQIERERYEEDPYIQLTNGDILVTKDGTIGKVAKVTNLDKPACLNSGIFVLKQKKNKNKFTQGYLYWTLQSKIFKDFIKVTTTGTTILHLYQYVFDNMPLLVPSIEEQEVISAYLDKKTAEIDEQIELQEQQIQLIEELKQSIISQAVTGKIKVI